MTEKVQVRPSRTWQQSRNPVAQALRDPQHLQGSGLASPLPLLCSARKEALASGSTSVFPQESSRLLGRCLSGAASARAPDPIAQPDLTGVRRITAWEPPPQGGRCWVTSGEFFHPAVLVTLYTRENRAEEGSDRARPREAQGHGPATRPRRATAPDKGKGRESPYDHGGAGQQA